MLVEVGDVGATCYVVIGGRLEIVHPTASGEVVVLAPGPGAFTGEAAMLAGRPALARIRAGAASTVVAIDRARLLAVVHSRAP